MRRMVDLRCPCCGYAYERICEEDEVIYCPRITCKEIAMEQQWWTRTPQSRTQIDEKDAIVVFKKPDGTFSYPAVNTKPTPEGCERIVMRSRREVENHERLAGVRNEHLWFDSNGHGFDDDSTMRPVPKPVDPALLSYLRWRDR